MGSDGGVLAEWAGTGGDQVEQAVEVERHRQPVPCQASNRELLTRKPHSVVVLVKICDPSKQN